MRFFFIILSSLAANLAAQAQLAITIGPPRITGQKAIMLLTLSNGLPEKIQSARAVMFLLDAEGKVVGHAGHWIIGGETNHPPLAAGETNAYHFVVPVGNKGFVANRLTVTNIKLDSGKTANPVTQAEVRSGR